MSGPASLIARRSNADPNQTGDDSCSGCRPNLVVLLVFHKEEARREPGLEDGNSHTRRGSHGAALLINFL
jgi:hypothetical protein